MAFAQCVKLCISIMHLNVGSAATNTTSGIFPFKWQICAQYRVDRCCSQTPPDVSELSPVGLSDSWLALTLGKQENDDGPG